MLPVVATPTTVLFANIIVTDVNVSSVWVAVLLAPTSSLPALSFSVVFNQTSGTAEQAASCPVAPVTEHHGSKTRVALISSFGAIIWLVSVFFTVKYTCSQQYFTFANFVSMLPKGSRHAAPAADATMGADEVYGNQHGAADGDDEV